MPLIRLQKYLSDAGVCSRRKGEEYIAGGLVRVNGETVLEMGVKIDPEIDRVEFRGKPVKPEEKSVIIALNKPRGYICSCKRGKDPIVLDLVKVPERIYPVGRLDKDSSGLLLMTNEGPLHHRLSHPSFDHEKEYVVTTDLPISDGALKKMWEGMIIDGVRTRRARVKRMASDTFRIVLKEGKKRQIRRMVQQVGNRVSDLNRIRIADIHLGTLKIGSWRYLTPREVRSLDMKPRNI